MSEVPRHVVVLYQPCRYEFIIAELARLSELYETLLAMRNKILAYCK
jgi:hypothetical protein